MLKIILLSALLLAIYSQTACSNIPADSVYYLTSFCDQQTSCGKSCGNCTWGYSADRQRFGCGSVISCTRSGKSINLEVIDYGPDCELEKKSGKPIIDASYSACKLFTGSNSCGWSDRLAVTCKKISSAAMAFMVPRGECTWDIGAATEEVPYCHISTLAHRYSFENIEQWVEHSSMLVGK